MPSLENWGDGFSVNEYQEELFIVALWYLLFVLQHALLSHRHQTEGGLVHRLVHIEEPILKIPNICIHLARQDVHKAFNPNTEEHM